MLLDSTVYYINPQVIKETNEVKLYRFVRRASHVSGSRLGVYLIPWIRSLMKRSHYSVYNTCNLQQSSCFMLQSSLEKKKEKGKGGGKATQVFPSYFAGW